MTEDRDTQGRDRGKRMKIVFVRGRGQGGWVKIGEEEEEVEGME